MIILLSYQIYIDICEKRIYSAGAPWLSNYKRIFNSAVKQVRVVRFGKTEQGS